MKALMAVLSILLSTQAYALSEGQVLTLKNSFIIPAGVTSATIKTAHGTCLVELRIRTWQDDYNGIYSAPAQISKGRKFLMTSAPDAVPSAGLTVAVTEIPSGLENLKVTDPIAAFMCLADDAYHNNPQEQKLVLSEAFDISDLNTTADGSGGTPPEG